MNEPSDKNFTTMLEWLTIGTRDVRFLEVIWARYCRKLREVGVPIGRASLHLFTNHPQWLGARMVWTEELDQADISYIDYDVRNRSEYIGSPANEIMDGAASVRENLAMRSRNHDVYDEMRDSGLSDYIAWPLAHTLGKHHIVTFATSEAEGFRDEHIAFLYRLLPTLALVSEIRMKNRLARTLLETYVGRHASELILSGATRRGSGTSVNAAILLCDLRGFTKISDTLPRDDVIELLNNYFDTVSEPIERLGGEILKFMGDGILAVFPTDDPLACINLVAAVLESGRATDRLNARLITEGREPLEYGVGIHVGDVMYGNIGSRTRLDFTVVGPAVNLASRLEALTKALGRSVLMSKQFAEMIGDQYPLEALGNHFIEGLGRPVEVFAFGDTLRADSIPAIGLFASGSLVT